ncbi:aldo/keto reductase [Pseudolysinimonas sp.]|uniref:aldo/keto reductase n=1 Tax=Pseudolysinimonas sp. TaxID=2680009 RepID=UPI003F7D7FC9
MTTPVLDALRPFGRTGVEVTPLAIGTSSWGEERAGESVAERTARVATMADAFFARRLPSNLLDTSNMYGDHHSEEHIGAAIARVGGVPDGLVVQTKLDRDTATGDFGGDRMRASLAESLERLGLDRIPVLYLHDPENIGFEAAMAPGGAVEALVAMKEEGRATAIGISGGPVDMLQRFVETDLFDALVTHNRFTLLDRSADALLDAAAERNVGVTNAAPYGAGVLTGDPRFADRYGYRPIHPETRAALERMAALCADAGVELAAAALQFSLREARVHATVVGPGRIERIAETERWATAPIPDGLWSALEAARPPAEVALDRL